MLDIHILSWSYWYCSSWVAFDDDGTDVVATDVIVEDAYASAAVVVVAAATQVPKSAQFDR